MGMLMATHPVMPLSAEPAMPPCRVPGRSMFTTTTTTTTTTMGMGTNKVWPLMLPMPPMPVMPVMPVMAT